MRRLGWLLMILTAVGALSACATDTRIRSAASDTVTPTATTSVAVTPTANTSTAPTSAASAVGASPAQEQAIAIGDFGFNDIANLDVAGCGMTLWRTEEASKSGGDRRFILFNGLEADSMLMKLNGNVVRFRRTAASGDDFYGQKTSQTFVSPDDNTTVRVDVNLGKIGEIESVAIQDGTLRVEQGNTTVEVPVLGDAGC